MSIGHLFKKSITLFLNASGGKIGEIIGEKRPQNIKEFASNTASAFAYWLIYKFYDNENN